MKKILVIIWMCLCYSGHVSAQGIEFVEGNLAQALEQATKEGKLVFVDFYADWCAPCKQMAKDIFTQKEVGEYYNQKFINVKVDTESEANKPFVRKYKVNSLPTLLFLQADGKQISRSSGGMSAADFIKLGKVVTGDELGFEKAYDKYKSSKKDMELLQRVLEEAPAFVSVQEGIDRQKWVTRVENLYKEYIQEKPMEEMINKADFKIIQTFHKPGKKDDKLVEFMNANLEKYIEKVGKNVAAYVLEHNNKVISTLARSGDEEYKKHLERVNGDMKQAYSVMPERKVSAYDRIKNLYDGEYIIFYKKDAPAYIALKNKYFEELSNDVNDIDYGGAVQDLYAATNGKISDEAHRQASEWVVKALQFPKITVMNKVNLLTMLGDSHRVLKEYEQAKVCYNQAFMEALQIPQKMTQTAIQMKIKQKLASLALMKK